MKIDERIKWIEKNGHHILVQDLSNCNNPPNMRKVLDSFVNEVFNTKYETFNTLTNLIGTKFEPEVFLYMKNVAKKVRPSLANSKRAMLGIDSPSRIIMFKGMNLFAGGNPSIAFKTMEEALEYLSS
jgi:hypothetical protein